MLLSNTPFHRVYHPHRDRASKRRRRFLAIIAEGLRSATGCRFLGKDIKTAKLLKRHGIPAEDIGINLVALGDQVLHVVAVPNRFWYCRETSRSLHQAKAAAASQGQRWLMIPQRTIEALASRNDIRPSEFFDLVLHRAMMNGPYDDDCRDRYHDPSGCYAMRLATGAGCHH